MAIPAWLLAVVLEMSNLLLPNGLNSHISVEQHYLLHTVRLSTAREKGGVLNLRVLQD